MKIYKNSQKTEVLNIEHAIGFKLAETGYNEFVQLSLSCQGKITAHSLPVHVIFYVLNGTGLIQVNQNKYTATQGDIIEVQANDTRSWSNMGTNNLELLVIKQKIS